HRLLRWFHALERTDLALTFELGPMDPVQVHESSRQRKCFIVRLRLDKGVTADHLPRFGEWTVDHRDLTARQTDPFPFCCRLQPCRVDDGSVLHRLADKFSHCIK